MGLTLRLAALFAGLLALLPVQYAWRLAGRSSPWPRRFLAWVGRCAGLRVRVTGDPLARHVLFVSNHLSWLDIMAVAGAPRAAFVSKGEVDRSQVSAWLASLNTPLFLARPARRAVQDHGAPLCNRHASGHPSGRYPARPPVRGHGVRPVCTP